jgi:D-amino peptidase
LTNVKVLISSDLEGVSGVDDYRQIFPVYPDLYEKARLLLTEDLNAAIRGLRSAGATEIDVIDGHGGGVPPYINIVKDKIESGVRVLAGFVVGVVGLYPSLNPVPLDSYDAHVIIGYHSMAGTLHGFLPHTASMITAVRINGAYVGETEMSAYGAGVHNLPTVLVTGDAAVVREAKSLLPGIEGVIVKKALSRKKAECLPLDEARSLIQRAACDCLSNLEKFKAFKPSLPVHLDVMFGAPELAYLAATLPRSRLSGDRTLSYVAEDYNEAVKAFWTALSLATGGEQLFLTKKLAEVEEAKNILDEWLKTRARRWVDEPNPFPPIGDFQNAG